jgi:hypothetical protein
MSSDDTTWSGISDILFPSDIWDPIRGLIGTQLSFVFGFLIMSAVAWLVLLYLEKTKNSCGAWNPASIGWFIVCIVVIFLLIAWWIGSLSLGGTEILNTTPNTCAGDYGSLEAGMCYKKCKDGYHGAATMCVADTFNIGVGTVVGLEPCRDGYRNEGLLCSSVRGDGCAWKLFGACMPGIVGDVYGRLDHGGVCPGPQDFQGNYDDEYKKWKRANDKPDPVVDPATGQVESLDAANKAGHKTCADISEVGTDKHTDKIDGMCYKPCPPGQQHVPGMPYLCYRGGDLTYDRGIGHAPSLFRFFGKYTWPW